MPSIHANNFEFYEVDHVIQKEPLDFIDPELCGLATSRAIFFRNRDSRSPIFPNSQWRTGFIGDDYRWLAGDGLSGRNLDAGTNFFYMATVCKRSALNRQGVF